MMLINVEEDDLTPSPELAVTRKVPGPWFNMIFAPNRRVLPASFIVFPPGANIQSIAVIRTGLTIRQLDFYFSDGATQTLKDDFR